MIVRQRLASVSALIVFVALSPMALAAGWSSVQTPKNSFLDGLGCRSTRWCMGVGTGRTGLTAAFWNGRRWKLIARPRLPAHAEGGSLSAVTCRSEQACVAVGLFATGQYRPERPLIERWNGRAWRIETAPTAPAPAPYRASNTYLAAVACPGARLCFAVGHAVPFGAGNAPGGPLIERWNGSRWRLARSPPGDSPLTALSCTATRICTAVGGFEYVTGTPDAGNEQVRYASIIERWSGSTWSLGSLTPPAGADGAGLLGVSCTSLNTCMGVGSQLNTVNAVQGVNQSIAGAGDGTLFSAAPVPNPPGADRGGSSSGEPQTVLTAIACTTSAQCAAVGHYEATNGALGPLAAIWNGTGWAQTALRRGPVALSSVACPALGWCLSVGDGIAERWIG